MAKPELGNGVHQIKGWELLYSPEDPLSGGLFKARIPQDDRSYMFRASYRPSEIVVPYVDELSNEGKRKIYSKNAPHEVRPITAGPIELVDRKGIKISMFSFGGTAQWDYGTNASQNTADTTFHELTMQSPAPVFIIGDSRQSTDTLIQEKGNVGELLYTFFATAFAKYRAGEKDDQKIYKLLRNADPRLLFLSVLAGTQRYHNIERSYYGVSEESSRQLNHLYHLFLEEYQVKQAQFTDFENIFK